LQIVRNDENQDNCISPRIKRDDREIQQNTWQYDKEFRNWDLYVNLLLAAYRSSPHPATGFTPNLMMLGREINIPKNILLSECSTKEPEDTDDYVKNLGTKMNEVFNLARDNLKVNGERQKRDHDT
jgi:hypothetical protein